MKLKEILPLLLMCVLTVTLYAQTDNPCRESINLNSGWKYMRGDFANADRMEYDDSEWETEKEGCGAETFY